LLDLAKGEVDFLEERRAAKDLKEASCGKERIRLGAAQRNRPTLLARRNAHDVRLVRCTLHRFDVGVPFEFLDVPAHAPRGDPEDGREFVEGEAGGARFEGLSEALKTPRLRKFPGRASRNRLG
jgi:hypothetical protein